MTARAWSAITFKETSVFGSSLYFTPARFAVASIIGKIKSVSKFVLQPCNTEANRSRPAPVSIFLCCNGS